MDSDSEISEREGTEDLSASGTGVLQDPVEARVSLRPCILLLGREHDGLLQVIELFLFIFN